ncbi:MAG TPA: DUF1559 domain-containing protein [Pirellulaceae bacterium]|nr:DUF1559 domain-containing protein [Pirellulaceae bacterium]HMO92722.1 DUF1559 domain-containing protein [Pirellulaceae bacterium]HMP70274.1 DUF1559 domain-containing protein [Pirellulaceae bacterium]
MYSNARPSRRGFTIIELLVVVAVIGILMAILVPAIHQVRESARRTNCASNLRQIGTAVSNYHSVHRHYPVNQIGYGVPVTGGGRGPGYYSWLVPLLPHMDQDNVFKAFNLNVNNSNGGDELGQFVRFRIDDAHPNAMAVSSTIPSFLCPSDSPGKDNTVFGTANPAPGSYVSNAGWPSYATGIAGERATPGIFNGVIPLVHPSFPPNWRGKPRIGVRDVSDGLSNTTLASERMIQTGMSAAEINNGDPRLQVRHLLNWTETLGEIVNQMTSTHAHVQQSAYMGRAWASGSPWAAPFFMHVMTPNTASGYYNSQAATTQGTDFGDFVVTPSSFHPGGVNVVMVDGSTKFVADFVDPQIWWAVGGRTDGIINASLD